MSLVNENWSLCRYVYNTNFIASYALCAVSLLTVTAISVDRLLALLLGLRYKQVVTLKRTYAIVAIFWIVSIITSTSYLLHRLITIWYGNIVIPLCVVTSVTSYCKIFLTLRHHQINPLNIARYKKAVSSALWVQCALVACYLPFGVYVVSSVLGRENILTSFEYLISDLTV